MQDPTNIELTPEFLERNRKLVAQAPAMIQRNRELIAQLLAVEVQRKARQRQEHERERNQVHSRGRQR